MSSNSPLIGGLVPALLLGANNPTIQPLLTRFKQTIQNHYPEQSGLQAALTQLENRPTSENWQRTFQEEAEQSGAAEDTRLITLVREMSEMIKHTSSLSATVTAQGNNTFALGQGNTVVGSRGVYIGGSTSGSIVSGDNNTINIGAPTQEPVLLSQHLASLRDQISQVFDKSELKGLCFDLRITADDLPGETRTEIAQALVAYCHNRGRIPELLKQCQVLRPHLAWSL